MNKSKGYYFGYYDVDIEKYLGIDFSKRCFIFPGQGSAFPGMLKNEYYYFKEIRDKFDLADSLSKKFKLPKISDYILKPEKIKKEKLPAVANLALFTLETALFDILLKKKIVPNLVTSHSFGEYAALVSVGILDFKDMFEIVYNRDRFCPPINSAGYMIAVNLQGGDIKNALAGKEYYISNFNSPNQTVISVSNDGANKISQELEAKKIKSKILSGVPQPYHSPYLNTTQKKIAEYLKNKDIKFNKPNFALFSSVLGRVINKNNFKKEDVLNILAKQILNQVDFINQINSAYDLGCFSFIELGPKKLLSFFVEDILSTQDREFKMLLVSDILKRDGKGTARSLNFKDSKFLSVINKVIKKITGYEIEQISFEDKFQDDLGIDSIKKADILLTILNESKINPDQNFNTSEFESIGDVVSYLEKAEKNPIFNKSEKNIQPKPCNFNRYNFSPVEYPLTDYSIGEVNRAEFFDLNIKEILEGAGNNALDKIKSFLNDNEGSHEPLNMVIHVDNQELTFNDVLSFYKFFRDFLNLKIVDDFNLLLVSRGGISNREAYPYIQCLASFLKSVKKELPGIYFKHIHFDDHCDPKFEKEIILKEFTDALGVDVLYKNKKRYTYEPKLASNQSAELSINSESVLVAIGGAKGITLSLIKDISKKYNPTIYLVGKSSGDNELVRKNIEELKRSNIKIHYESLNACDKDALETLFSKIVKTHKKIDLVINGAGVVKIKFLSDRTDDELSYEFDNKVYPAFNILNLAGKYKIKQIINFASIISRYGSAGQSIYTSANELVSELTRQYSEVLKRDGCNAIVVHWPPWNGVGMTEDKVTFQKLKEYGVCLLEPKKANKLFIHDLLSQNLAPVYYLSDFDDLFYGFTLNNLKKNEPLIGKMADAFSISATDLIFEKTFNLNIDKYLEDHKIRDLSYVPAAVGITMFLCLGNMYFKKIPNLKNVVINNPIVVKKDGVQCFLGAEIEDAVCRFSIKSTVPHFFGEISMDSGTVDLNLPRVDLDAYFKTAKKQGAVSKSIYSDFFEKNNLFLGRTFQSISEVFSDGQDNILIGIDNAKLPPVLGVGTYDRLIQLIDGAFQALGVAALKHGHVMIPTQVSEIIFSPNSEISNYMYAKPLNLKFSDTDFSGDILLLNEGGEVIIKLGGIVLKKINETKQDKVKNNKI